MIALKVTQVGNSVGVVLPKEALVELGVEKGQTLYLSPYDDSVQRQVALGEKLMDEHRDVFRALAK